MGVAEIIDPNLLHRPGSRADEHTPPVSTAALCTSKRSLFGLAQDRPRLQLAAARVARAKNQHGRLKHDAPLRESPEELAKFLQHCFRDPAFRALAVLARPNQLGPDQLLKVMRDGRLADAQPPPKLTDAEPPTFSSGPHPMPLATGREPKKDRQSGALSRERAALEGFARSNLFIFIYR